MIGTNLSHDWRSVFICIFALRKIQRVHTHGTRNFPLQHYPTDCFWSEHVFFLRFSSSQFAVRACGFDSLCTLEELELWRRSLVVSCEHHPVLQITRKAIQNSGVASIPKQPSCSFLLEPLGCLKAKFWWFSWNLLNFGCRIRFYGFWGVPGWPGRETLIFL